MPRLTSFVEGDHDELLGNEWIVQKEERWGFSLHARPLYAVRGDRKVELGSRTADTTRSLRIEQEYQFPHGYAGYYVITLSLGGSPVTITVQATRTGDHIVMPEDAIVQLASARTKVGYNGVGIATYRNAWKDSDSAKHIIAFIDAQSDDPADEESLVWLAGTLGKLGMPVYLTNN
ncbi:MAG: hypothetical protein GC165_15520 [Armatimonadetes bacterium]|nr:hypothetical protein [Armatimonadota bacterium]